MKEVKRKNKKHSKIKRISLVDQVGDAIKQDIVDGVWSEGEKLPSETEFAESFGVNRLSVRMALQKLSTLGIIETRVGEGSFVRGFSFMPFFKEIAVLYKDKNVQGELRQFRNLIECECLRLAVDTAREDEIKELKDRLDKYDAQLQIYCKDTDSEKELEKLVDLDFAFHYKIVEMSRNSIYLEIYDSVKFLIREQMKQLLSNRIRSRIGQNPEKLKEDEVHRKIFEAITNADKTKAKDLSFEMLNFTKSDLI